jgi:glycine hydroxymethyltransferase
VLENLAIERAKVLFGSQFANVQPHSGAQANMAVMFALLKNGDTVLGLDLAHGGHVSHGMRLNYSGRSFNVVSYGTADDGRVDMSEVRQLAITHRPKVIIAGWSACPRHLDFARFREIADEIDALLLVDMAHFAGLVAAGLHPNPIPYAQIVTSTTHKTLGGPRGGLILTNEEHLAKKINVAVFPGLQGGPLEHVIAAKSVCFLIAGGSEFAERQARTLEGDLVIAERLSRSDVVQLGIRVVTGGTDVHLVLLDLRESSLDGRQAEERLHETGITVNRNAVPDDPRPPLTTSGLRIGTPALATRGFRREDFESVGEVLAQSLRVDLSAAAQTALRDEVLGLALKHPLYQDLAPFIRQANQLPRWRTNTTESN